MSFGQKRRYAPPTDASRRTVGSTDWLGPRSKGANRARPGRSLQTMIGGIGVILGLHSGIQGSAQPTQELDGRVQTAQIRVCLESYVRHGQFGGFYDFEKPGSVVSYGSLEPAQLELPAGAWPVDHATGFGAFYEAGKALERFSQRTDVTPALRSAVFSELLKLFEDYPFLQYQHYYRDAESDGATEKVPNNIFVQQMSRTLLLATLAVQPRTNVAIERQAMARTLFPASANGRNGAALLNRHGLLLAGFGVRADVEPAAHRTPLVVKGWKSTRGRHSGGIFDFSYFTDEYIAEVSHLLDLVPKHLLGGDGPKALTSVTCHGYFYIYEMEDFAGKYFPGDASSHGSLGYLHGQTLNVFGPATTRMADGVSRARFRRELSGHGPGTEVQRHEGMITVAHELTHFVDATIARKRPDYKQRLQAIIKLGVQERSNIRAIDSALQNFEGSGKPAYEWFSQAPQEMAATAANVMAVDPMAVLLWCVQSAKGTNGVLAPLNHFLWFVDVHSLDPGFHETDKTFLLTLQPTGRRFARIECQLRRDPQHRIESLSVPGRVLRFSYNPAGFAGVAD